MNILIKQRIYTPAPHTPHTQPIFGAAPHLHGHQDAHSPRETDRGRNRPGNLWSSLIAAFTVYNQIQLPQQNHSNALSQFRGSSKILTLMPFSAFKAQSSCQAQLLLMDSGLPACLLFAKKWAVFEIIMPLGGSFGQEDASGWVASA